MELDPAHGTRSGSLTPKARHRVLIRLVCHRLVFLDETSVTTKMTRLRGRSRKGTRLHAKAPFGH